METKDAKRNAVVIYHGGCTDGFTAAWIFHRWYESQYDDVKYHAATYGELPPPVTSEDDVFILDFSYAPEVVCNIACAAKSVELLDHHKTAKEAFDKFFTLDQEPIPNNLHVHFDMTKSGAGLAWERFRITEEYGKIPLLVLHVQDYDLWKFEHPDTKPFITHLSIHEKSFAEWTAVHDYIEHGNGYDEFITSGKVLDRQFERLCNDIIATGSKEITIDGIKGLGCNAPGMFASRIGNILADRSGTFGATWYESKDGSTKFSLRSVGEFDVSGICRNYGGGGHRNAAGFTLEPKELVGGVVQLWSGKASDETTGD